MPQYTVTAHRNPNAPTKLPELVQYTAAAMSPAGALAQFRRHIEQNYQINPTIHYIYQQVTEERNSDV